jgi:hypothetical protein
MVVAEVDRRGNTPVRLEGNVPRPRRRRRETAPAEDRRGVADVCDVQPAPVDNDCDRCSAAAVDAVPPPVGADAPLQQVRRRARRSPRSRLILHLPPNLRVVIPERLAHRLVRRVEQRVEEGCHVGAHRRARTVRTDCCEHRRLRRRRSKLPQISPVPVENSNHKRVARRVLPQEHVVLIHFVRSTRIDAAAQLEAQRSMRCGPRRVRLCGGDARTGGGRSGVERQGGVRYAAEAQLMATCTRPGNAPRGGSGAGAAPPSPSTSIPDDASSRTPPVTVTCRSKLGRDVARGRCITRVLPISFPESRLCMRDCSRLSH